MDDTSEPNRYLLLKDLVREFLACEGRASEDLLDRARAAVQKFDMPSAAQETLNTIDPEADACCGRALRKVFDQQSARLAPITCGSCGTEFVAEMVGPVRYWRIKPWFATVRPQ